jgi:hypothetical protein
MSSWEALPPAGQAAHPDTPPGRLLELVRHYPEEVLSNPGLPLLGALWHDRRTEQEQCLARLRALSQEHDERGAP